MKPTLLLLIPALVASSAHGSVTVSFANSGAGFGPTPPFVVADAAASTITLSFSIGAAGVVSLDASTDSASPATLIDAINEWDSANVGSVSVPAFFNQSFTLVGSASGGTDRFTLSELDGGGIGIQGENSNRVDGSLFGANQDQSNPETLTWTLTAPAGMTLDFTAWSRIAGAGGDIRIADADSVNDFENMVGNAGSETLTGITLAGGQSLTMNEIPGLSNPNGAGLGGFEFSVIPEPSSVALL